jgi:hypothetical protein
VIRRDPADKAAEQPHDSAHNADLALARTGFEGASDAVGATLSTARRGRLRRACRQEHGGPETDQPDNRGVAGGESPFDVLGVEPGFGRPARADGPWNGGRGGRGRPRRPGAPASSRRRTPDDLRSTPGTQVSTHGRREAGRSWASHGAVLLVNGRRDGAIPGPGENPGLRPGPRISGRIRPGSTRPGTGITGCAAAP